MLWKIFITCQKFFFFMIRIQQEGKVHTRMVDSPIVDGRSVKIQGVELESKGFLWGRVLKDRRWKDGNRKGITTVSRSHTKWWIMFENFIFYVNNALNMGKFEHKITFGREFEVEFPWRWFCFRCNMVISSMTPLKMWDNLWYFWNLVCWFVLQIKIK